MGMIDIKRSESVLVFICILLIIGMVFTPFHSTASEDDEYEEQTIPPETQYSNTVELEEGDIIEWSWASLDDEGVGVDVYFWIEDEDGLEYEEENFYMGAGSFVVPYDSTWSIIWANPTEDTFVTLEYSIEIDNGTEEDTDGFLELDIWIIIAIIFIVIAAIAFVGQKYFENKESTRESQQQYQQPSQQQSSVPPPTKQSSQQSEGQSPQQQTQQNPPPPPPKNCPSCNAEMRYVDEHRSWWCDRCQEYK